MNGHFSNWNTHPCLVNKVENPDLNNELWLAFNYSQHYKVILGIDIELTSQVYNYILDPQHSVFIKVNFKYSYFSITFHFENCKKFTFYVNNISQLQSTCML